MILDAKNSLKNDMRRDIKIYTVIQYVAANVKIF
jgi:hypothetical protein